VNSEIELEPEVIAEIESGRKVTAIKKLRELRGIGLKEAKDIVDSYSYKNPDLSSASTGSESSSGSGALIGFIMVFGALGYLIYKFAS